MKTNVAKERYLRHSFVITPLTCATALHKEKTAGTGGLSFRPPKEKGDQRDVLMITGSQDASATSASS